MLAKKILSNINARLIHRTAQRLIRMAPVLYSNSPEFGYSHEKQKSWSKLYPGWSRQYPIVIYSGAVEMIGMAPLKLEGYDKTFPGRLAIGNNGHTVSISLIQDNKNPQCNSCRPPTISGGLLKNAYEFEGLHFHWTNKNNRGFEHVIDNMRYPLEMHLVHRNIKYDCIEKALKHEDGLCVAAVFFDVSEMPYKAFNTIIDNFIYIQNMNSNISLDCGLILNTLLPANTQNFYTYKGSLLSPPYNKSINWIIFAQPIYISFDQLSAFQLLQKNQDSEIFDNCRIIQPIEDKKVYVRDPNITFTPACDVPCPSIPITTNAGVTGSHVPNTIYNEMYFPISRNDGHHQSNKIVLPNNSTSTNKELLGSSLTKKQTHNSTTPSYEEMYFPISSKNDNQSDKKLLDAYSSATTKEVFEPNVTTKKEHQQSPSETYNEMCCPILPKNETQSEEKKLDTSTNKEMFDPNITKEEHHDSPTAYNEMCIPMSPKNENVSNKKLESNLTSTDNKTLDPTVNKEDHQPNENCNDMYFPMSSKDERETNQKIETNEREPNKDVLTPTLTTKKNADNTTTAKKEYCNPIATNVLSTKTQERGLMASIRNMIKDALIKFFSK